MSEKQTLAGFLDERPGRVYRYTGTTWGNEEYTATAAEFAAMLRDLGYDGDMADTHPAYGNYRYNEDGERIGEYYTENGDDRIGYAGRSVQEIVLEAVD